MGKKLAFLVMVLALLSSTGIAYSPPQPDAPEVFAAKEKDEALCDITAWLIQRLSEESDLQAVYELATLLQKLGVEAEVVGLAFTKLLKLAWDGRKPDLVRQAISSLQEFIGTAALKTDLVFAVLANISEAYFVRRERSAWEEVQNLATKTLQRFSVKELWAVVTAETTVYTKLSALSYIAKKPEEARTLVLAMVEYAEKTQHVDLFRAILDTLDRIQPPVQEEWDKLLSMLEAENTNVQIAALRVLARVAPELGDRAALAIPRLTQMLNSPNRDVGDLAATVLSNLGEPGRAAALKILIEKLKNDPDRRAFAEAIMRMTPIPEDELRSIANALERTWYDEVRALLLEALLKSGPNGEAIAVDFVIRKWTQYGYDIPSYTVIPALERGLQRCNPSLAGQLWKYKGNWRYAILFRRAASQECLTPEISMEIEDCRSLLRMASPARRIEAAKILAWMGPVARSAYGDLIEALKRETSADVRQELCKALIEMGPPEEGFIEQLEPLAKHSDPQVRQIAATILGTVLADIALETKVIDILLNLATDNEPSVREAAWESIRKRPAERSLPNVITLSTHENPDVRRALAEILGDVPVLIAARFGVCLTLQDLASDNDPAVRATAIRSLAKLITQNK